MEEEEARRGYSEGKGPEVGQVWSVEGKRAEGGGAATVMREEHEQMGRWMVRK